MGRFENSATCIADEALTCYDGSNDDFNSGSGSELVITGTYPTCDYDGNCVWAFEYECELTGSDTSCAGNEFLENANCKLCSDRWSGANSCDADEPTSCVYATEAIVVYDATGYKRCEETGTETTCDDD